MKCPHCGHPDRIHAGTRAKRSEPGTCLCGPPDNPCPCPGWDHWNQRGRDWQLELEMEQDRENRAFGRSLYTLYEPDD